MYSSFDIFDRFTGEDSTTIWVASDMTDALEQYQDKYNSELEGEHVSFAYIESCYMAISTKNITVL